MQSLNELEIALAEVTARLKALTDENARLRAELLEKSERMRTAGAKLRVVAERLPQPQPVAAAEVKQLPREKAA